MSLISIITIMLLIIMSLFHFYWAFGGKLGIDKVIPQMNNEALFKPGKILTIFVAIVLLAFSFLAYILHFSSQYSQLIITLGYSVSALFIIRSIGDFKTVGFLKKVKDTEFAKYDSAVFSPLCMFLGVSFALLSMQI